MSIELANKIPSDCNQNVNYPTKKCP